jgi:hypothetical protein
VEADTLTDLTFNIPYVFQVKGIPRRGTKQRTEFAFETISVPVRSLLAEDAPVAATFPATLGDVSYKGERGLVTLRLHDDRLYAKSIHNHYDDTLSVTSAMLSAFLEKGIYAVEHGHRLREVLPDTPETTHRVLHDKDEYHIKPFSEDKWLEWRSEDRIAKRTIAQQLFNDLIIIDGDFWRSVSEPVYLLERHHQEGHDYISTRVITIDDAKKRDTNQIFGLVAWDQMRMEAEGRYLQTPDESERATVFIDEAFSYDDKVTRFIKGIAEATDHDGDLLKSFDVDSMVRWASMRDALVLARTLDFAQHTLDALAEAAERFATGPKASKLAIDMIEKSLSIHDHRPVDIDIRQDRRI